MRISDWSSDVCSSDLMEDLPREARFIPHEECSAEGRCVPRTATPVDVFDLTREATERIEATDNDKLNALVNQLADVTEGKRATITDLVTGIDDVASAINEREVELETLQIGSASGRERVLRDV